MYNAAKNRPGSNGTVQNPPAASAGSGAQRRPDLSGSTP
jgi:hypothetical protein